MVSGSVDIRRIVPLDGDTTYYERLGIDRERLTYYYEHTISSTVNINFTENQVSVTTGLRQTIPQQDLAPEPVFAFEYEYSQMIQNAQDNPTSPAIGPNIITIEDTLEGVVLGAGGAALVAAPRVPTIINTIREAATNSIRTADHNSSFSLGTSIIPVIPNPEPIMEVMERVRRDTIMYNEDGETNPEDNQMRSI